MAKNKSKIADSYVQLIPVIDGLSDEMAKQFKEGFEEAEKKTEPVAEESGKKSGGKFAGGMVAAVAASGAAAAVGKMFGDAVTGALDQMDVNSNIGASLALDEKDLAKVTEAAKGLFEENYGADYADIAGTMKAIVGTVKGARDMSKEQLQLMGRDVANISSTWELSAEEVTAAASSMVNNGMAKDFGDATSQITAGFQELGQHGADWLDTVTEFGGDFAQFGFTGGKAIGLVRAALQAGVKDTDKLADSLNEASITINSGAIDENLVKINIDPKQLRKDIAAGGETARAALIEVLTKLQKDGDVNNFAAVFGSIGEDFRTAFMNMDLSSVNAGLQEASGNMSLLDEAIHSGPKEALGDFQRTFEQAFIDVVIPILTDLTPVIKDISTFFKENEGAVQALAAVVGVGLVVGIGLATFALIGMAAAGWAAAAPILAMSWLPLLIIAGVAALVAAFWWMSDQFGGVTNMMSAAWASFVQGLGQMWQTILMIFGKIGEFFGKVFSFDANINGASIDMGMPQMADGGTVLPRAGGTPVILAEAGRAETVVDTGKFNNLLDDIESRKLTQQAGDHIEFNISTRDTESAEDIVAKISDYLEFNRTN